MKTPRTKLLGGMAEWGLLFIAALLSAQTHAEDPPISAIEHLKRAREKAAAAAGNAPAENRPAPSVPARKNPFDCLKAPLASYLPIRLLGEHHGSPGAMKNRNLQCGYVRNRSCVLGFEGYVCDTCSADSFTDPDRAAIGLKDAVSNPGCLACDDGFTYALSTLFLAFHEIAEKGSELESMNGILISISRNAMAQEAFWATQKELSGESDAEVQELLNSATKTKLPPARVTEPAQPEVLAFKQLWLKNRAARQKVVRHWMAQLIVLGEKDLASKGIQLPVDFHFLVSDSLRSSPHAVRFLDEVVLKLRNEMMFQNIAHLYCKYALATPPRELRLIVGDAHLEGLLKLLKMSAPTGVEITAHSIPPEYPKKP